MGQVVYFLEQPLSLYMTVFFIRDGMLLVPYASNRPRLWFASESWFVTRGFLIFGKALSLSKECTYHSVGSDYRNY